MHIKQRTLIRLGLGRNMSPTLIHTSPKILAQDDFLIYLSIQRNTRMHTRSQTKVLLKSSTPCISRRGLAYTHFHTMCLCTHIATQACSNTARSFLHDICAHISMHHESQSLKVGSALRVGEIMGRRARETRNEPLILWERGLLLKKKYSPVYKPDSFCLQLNTLGFYRCTLKLSPHPASSSISN